MLEKTYTSAEVLFETLEKRASDGWGIEICNCSERAFLAFKTTTINKEEYHLISLAQLHMEGNRSLYRCLLSFDKYKK